LTSLDIGPALETQERSQLEGDRQFESRSLQRYSLRLRIAPDARRDVLAIECRLDGDPKQRVYAFILASPGTATALPSSCITAAEHCGPNKAVRRRLGGG
jgi:hypothetical protein